MTTIILNLFFFWDKSTRTLNLSFYCSIMLIRCTRRKEVQNSADTYKQISLLYGKYMEKEKYEGCEG